MKSALIAAVCSAVLLTGCATAGEPVSNEDSYWKRVLTELVRDPRDAPWDPPQGRQLFEQIPPWDGEASKVCCGHLRECQPHQSPRC